MERLFKHNKVRRRGQTDSFILEGWHDRYFFHIGKTHPTLQLCLDTYLNKIIIEVNNEEPWDELVVRHEPKLPSCSVKEVIQASKIGHLNIEKLLMDTIQVNIWIIELIN